MYKKTLFIFASLFILLSLSGVIYADKPGNNLKDGTVIVWENGNYLNHIQAITGSNKTHAAIILYEDGMPYVYEASRPDVHRYPLASYYEIIEEHYERLPKLKVYFIEPKKEYTKEELIKMKIYANDQLGRAFGVGSYFSRRSLITIHCGEYVGNVIGKSGRIDSLGPIETPKTIYEKANKL
jgi:hypothetical protein